MLPNEKMARELKGMFNFLANFDRLFSSEIHPILDQSRTLLKKVEEAAELRRKLELVQSRGFNVRDVLNERFTSYNQMVKEIKDILYQVEEIQDIISAYGHIKTTITTDSDTVRQFEAILHNPKQHKEIKSLWAKIKDRGAK